MLNIWRTFSRINRDCHVNKTVRTITYEQGYSPKPGIREYFYYIDHQGQLFLDDAKIKNFTSCFKEKQFLAFFFKRLKFNDTGKYADDFPYISPCGREQNFIRCDDKPIVFTHVLEEKCKDTNKNLYYLGYSHAGDLLKTIFQPEHICMLPNTGRVYHPSDKCDGIGLVKSSLAIEFSKFLQYENPDDEESLPNFFTWKNVKYKLSQRLLTELDTKNKFS